MRYVHKFNNGAWKVFDTQWYEDAAIVGLESAAKELAEKFNLEEAARLSRKKR